MSIQNSIESKLQQAFTPSHLEIVNESHMHSGPATESHFKVIIASDGFDGLRLVQRHQKVYGLLSEEMAGEVHALALHTYTPSEWEEKGSAPESPNCMGGSKG
ncbi:MAG: BolA/IbaG family iron-sulfur metabolism protein [Cellvibrionaceae bacterium]